MDRRPTLSASQQADGDPEHEAQANRLRPAACRCTVSGVIGKLTATQANATAAATICTLV